MALDATAAAVLERLAADARPAADPADPASVVEAIRADHDRSAVWLSGPGAEVAEVLDVTAGAVGLRAYRPLGPWGALPAVVYAHGGGWMTGSVASYDSVCRALANEAGAIVVSVDYRLAPESPFPGPLADVTEALLWVLSEGAAHGIDPARIAIAGDSSGGNLAAVVARHARDREIALRAQLLIYPATDATLASNSYDEFRDGPGLTREKMEACWGVYLGTTSREDPDASPLRVPDLAGVAPAVILTAEVDPLRDDGESYAQRLRAAGVSCESERFDGVAHGFFRWLAVHDQAHAAIARAGEALRAALD